MARSEFDLEVPSWLSQFVREEVRPLLKAHRACALAALGRWVIFHKDQIRAQCSWELQLNELLSRLASLPRELRPELDDQQDGDSWCDMWRDPVDGMTHSIQLWIPREYNHKSEPPIDRPLPPPEDRDPSADECWAALLAIHDEVRDPRERIGPAADGNDYDAAWLSYGFLRTAVLVNEATHRPGLTEAHLPQLRTMLNIAADSTKPATSDEKTKKDTPPNGPEAGMRFWFNGRSVPVKGRTYSVINAVWQHNAISFELLRSKVGDEVSDATVSTWIHRANNALGPLNLPWKLETDRVNRYVRKRLR